MFLEQKWDTRGAMLSFRALSMRACGEAPSATLARSGNAERR